MLASPQTAIRKEQFLFADHLILDESPTRDFYAELLRGLTHKNNNVLSVVQGFSSLILIDQDQDEELLDNVKQMRNAAQISSALVERMMTAGGASKISLQPVSLPDFFQLAEGKLKDVCQLNGADLSIEVAPNLPMAEADVSRLREVVYELLKNAAEAAGKGGNVRIEVGRSEDFGMDSLGGHAVHLLVHNDGESLSEEQLPSVFKPFYTKKGSRHFGLGLTGAGVLAGQMKMRLGIASEPGRTTIWLAMRRSF